MKNIAAELVVVPSPGIGHLKSTVEFANHLILNDFSITILVISPVFASTTAQKNCISSNPRIKLVHLPPVDPPSSSAPEKHMSVHIDSHKSHVKDAVANLVSSNSIRLVGLVIDMFCTSMIDVANEFDLPSYLFFTSGAAALGFMFYLPTHYDQVGSEFEESGPDLIVPSYINPIPASVLPSFVLNKEWHAVFLSLGRRFKEVKGIFVNSFAELESHAVNSFSGGQTPPVYSVGPLLDLTGENKSPVDQVHRDKIMKWLDDQPLSSVIFLCFGSMGCFSESQLREIAFGLERSGYRFLWSIRRPPPEGKFVMPGNYDDHNEILPAGFLERIGEKGMVCGWAPQVEVLAHQAIGGFVSHCGWNSILESLWYGIPIVAWPLYAGQQLNAFEMVRDLGLAIELKLDYKMGRDLVMAEDIERVVRSVMNDDSQVREKVKAMKEKSRKAIGDGGSSSTSFRSLMINMLKDRS